MSAFQSQFLTSLLTSTLQRDSDESFMTKLNEIIATCETVLFYLCFTLPR